MDVGSNTRRDSKVYGTFGDQERDNPDNGTASVAIQVNRKNSGKSPRYIVDRKALNLTTLDDRVPTRSDCKSVFQRQLHSALKTGCNCSPMCVGGFIKRLFPLIAWLPQYKVKESILMDIIAGFTIAIIHVPQGMAYAQLASVSPIYGLYTSFYPVLIYFLMGTSRHISIGTFAVASLLASSAVDDVIHYEKTQHNPIVPTPVTSVLNSSNITPSTTPFTPSGSTIHSNIEVAMVVTFTAGIIQAAMGLLRMGALTAFMSDEMVSGFITGAVIHVFTSQLKPLTGVQFQKFSGPFNIVFTWISLFASFTSASYVVVLLSLASLVFLIIVKEGLNTYIVRKIKVPIPAELILVILGTVISYYMDLEKTYKVETVGFTQTGLQAPVIPPLELLPKVLTASIVLSIVSATTTLSMVIIYAKRHQYEVDMNQELLAYGFCNLISSFFFCIPSCASISRSAVQENSGAKSQITGIISCALLLVVLLAVGPLFESLPNCVLAAVVIVSLKGMLMQFRDLKKAWGSSKLDASVWVVTFLSVVILDMDYGLIIGVVFSLILVLFRSQYPETYLLGQVPGSDLYRSIDKYHGAKEIPGVKICHFGASVYFGNRDYFKSEITRLVSLKQRILTPRDITSDQNGKTESNMALTESCQEDDVHSVIISCSAIGYMDSGGVATLQQIIKDFDEDKINVYLAAVQESVLEDLENQGFFNHVTRNHIFPSVHDAVLFTQHQS